MKLRRLTAGLTALDLFHLSHICFCLVSVASGILSAVNISRLSAIYWRHVVWFLRYFLRIFRVAWHCKMQQPTFFFFSTHEFKCQHIWNKYKCLTNKCLNRSSFLNMYLRQSFSFICLHGGEKSQQKKSISVSPSFTRWCWRGMPPGSLDFFVIFSSLRQRGCFLEMFFFFPSISMMKSLCLLLCRSGSLFLSLSMWIVNYGEGEFGPSVLSTVALAPCWDHMASAPSSPSCAKNRHAHIHR